jgi:hydroxyacylglutathione hydrolase
MFQRFSDEGLAQTSFLIGCDRTGQAIVVDPRRDIDAYTTLASQRGLTLTHAIETHTHADFVSGARELAAGGAVAIVGPGADTVFQTQEVSHRQELRVGDIALTFLHTPGHTPEHISVVVREPAAPVRVLTGDTLFVGAVGRPDLLGEDQMRALAGDLFTSLFDVLLALDTEVEVHPGHGAGSLCGAGIGKAPHSTIGGERAANPLLQLRERGAFIAAVLGDLPDTPPYFPRMKKVNRHGPPLLGLANGVTPPAPLDAEQAAARLAAGAIVLDLRSAEAFGAGHVLGAFSLTFGPRVGYWAGWVVPPDRQLLLVVDDPRDAEEALRQLLRVGFDNVAGYLVGGIDAWRGSGRELQRLEVISARTLRERVRGREAVTIVDVRTPREYRSGHVDGAVNIAVSEIVARAGELRGRGPVATICESGLRSSLAASLLQAAGVDAIDVTDGTAAYRLLEAAG